MKENLAQLREKLSAKKRRMARLLSEDDRVMMPNVRKLMSLESEIQELEQQVDALA